MNTYEEALKAKIGSRKHKATPTAISLSTSAHATSICRWCDRPISQIHPHMGQNAVWRHDR